MLQYPFPRAVWALDSKGGSQPPVNPGVATNVRLSPSCVLAPSPCHAALVRSLHRRLSTATLRSAAIFRFALILTVNRGPAVIFCLGWGLVKKLFSTIGSTLDHGALSFVT